MKPLFSEVDPYTGLRTEYAVDNDGHMVERTVADNAAMHMDYSKALSNAPEYSQQGIKTGYWHVGHIPPEVAVKWLAEGFNVYAAHPSEVVAKLRQPEYAYLRTTHRKF